MIQENKNKKYNVSRNKFNFINQKKILKFKMKKLFNKKNKKKKMNNLKNKFKVYSYN